MSRNKKEFVELLNAYQGIIHKVNLIYFPVAEDRRDNFQEVALRMWKSYPALKDRTKPASWIYAIAINTSISKIRKDSRYVLSDAMEDNATAVIDDRAAADIDFQTLLSAIRRLKEIDRSIILLYMEDYSYAEIAEITGISGSNVGVRISRAKRQLEKLLKMTSYE